MELLLRKESLLSTIPNATPELAQELAEAIDKVLETAETELERSGESNSLTEYMDSHKLCSLYPRTAERLGCTTAPSAMTPTSPYSNPGDLPSHLAKMNLLNQCIGMGTQLYKDVNGLRNHKYLAHQIALLYVSSTRDGNTVSTLVHLPLPVPAITLATVTIITVDSHFLYFAKPDTGKV